MKMSRRYGWFSHTTRIDPLPSSTTASKILNPGRRVARRPHARIRPAIDTICPGLSEAIG
jgi:hypothetical protein